MKAVSFALAATLVASAASALPTTVQHAKRCSPDEVFPTWAANDGNIVYSSGWTVLTNQGSHDYQGVEAYSGQPCANYNFETPVPGYMTISAGKKHDRGYFDVFIGDEYLGTGDAYDPNCSSNCALTAVFGADLSNYQPGTPIRVQNRAYDSRLGTTPYIDVSEIVFVPANC